MATFLFFGCSTKQEVDMIFKNARVYTVNQNFEIAESFAIKDGQFVEVGSYADILKKYDANKVVDLDGKAVYPGFFDAHCHFLSYGLGLQEVNLTGTKSMDEILDRIKQFEKEKHSKYIIGRGWDQNDWEIKELPTNEKLNTIFPDIPVILSRIDGHALLANNKAIEMANIDKNSAVSGGKILFKNGKFTGIFIDNAMNLIEKSIPKPGDIDKIKALGLAEMNCFSVGLTTVDDAGLSCSDVKLIDTLQKSGRLKIRIYAMLEPSKENSEKLLKYKPIVSTKLNIRCVKLFADGALGSRGACLLKEYSDDPGNYGILVESREHLKEICQLAYNSGYQVAVHAIGDSAVRLVLNLYGEILKGPNDCRWRIEHSQVVDKDDFELFKKYTIIPSVQPTHATSDMYWAISRLGSERIRYAYAYKRLLETNGWLPVGSDFPVEAINPLFGFYAAVSRMDRNLYPKGGFQIEEAVTREQALKGMTIWAAKANFEENYKGSIEKGKMADFVVLDKDIMTIDISEIPKVNVLETYLSGDNVYRKNAP